MRQKRTLVAALALSAWSPLLFGSPLLAQSAWSKAPPVPRACYSGQDTFEADAEKAGTDLEALIETQKQVNRGLVGQILNMDPATLNQRMVAAVQRNPAKAHEIMESMQALGIQESQGAAMEADAEQNNFRARKAQLEAEYRAEVNATWVEVGANAAELGRDHMAGAFAKLNRQYETVLCPRWFGKQVPDLLASYRGYLAERRIPMLTEAERKIVPMAEMLGVSTKEFRPVGEMQSVLDYVWFANDLFHLREKEPRKVP